MVSDRRRDLLQGRIVDAAIRISTLWGCVSAWHYLRDRGVSQDVAVRVLASSGARRSGDAAHPAVRDALEREATDGIAQRTGDDGEALARANVASALAVERAIQLSAIHGRHYAESMLRMYGLDTRTIMRVLFEPHRRRRPVVPAGGS